MLVYRAPCHIQEVSPASCYSTAVYLVLLIKLFVCSVVAVELASLNYRCFVMLSLFPSAIFSELVSSVLAAVTHHFSSFHIIIFPSGVNNYSQTHGSAALITALPRYRKMYEALSRGGSSPERTPAAGEMLDRHDLNA